ncbi:hypothetical protein D3C77_739770 [compost metagenome]
MPKPGIASPILNSERDGCSSAFSMASSSCSRKPSSSWALILPMAIRRKLSAMKAIRLGSAMIIGYLANSSLFSGSSICSSRTLRPPISTISSSS